MKAHGQSGFCGKILNPINEEKENLEKRIVIPCRPDYGLLEKTYRKNELIAIFDKQPTSEEINERKKYLFDRYGIENIKIMQCGCCCDLRVQLWLADDIHTVISGNPVTGGSGGSDHTVGDNYSLNFLSKIPTPKKVKPNKHPGDPHNPQIKLQEDLITIAVLDTGVDLDFVDNNYIGKNLLNKTGDPCFKDSLSGWNFVDNTPDTNDDNDHLHGTLVTQYIIDQFEDLSEKEVKNELQIIPLKTHNKDGVGDLFAIYCAVHYAIAKGANIINASWGFYYYEDENTGAIKLLCKLIEESKENGILFVTAAGNETGEDDIAKEIYKVQHGNYPNSIILRDLDFNPFIPACLSAERDNMITVTTTDDQRVAPTENFSKEYVDLGVNYKAHSGQDFEFAIPFFETGTIDYISGSSFATAIASGVIGANCDKARYVRNTINRTSFINDLKAKGLCKENVTLKAKIKDGNYI
ncbi:MAG TPA: S8 family serine peptidase [Mucilaginibacter sp.]